MACGFRGSWMGAGGTDGDKLMIRKLKNFDSSSDGAEAVGFIELDFRQSGQCGKLAFFGPDSTSRMAGKAVDDESALEQAWRDASEPRSGYTPDTGILVSAALPLPALRRPHFQAGNGA